MSNNNSSASKLNIILYVVLLGVVVMLLFTTIVTALRLKQFLPDELESILLVQDDPSFEVEDSNYDIWSTNTQIEVFALSYKNGEGEVTVKSADTNKVIAPGTSNDYKFYLKNNGNTALQYNVTFNFDLSVENSTLNIQNFPVQVRIINAYNGEYVVGDDQTWVAATSVNSVEKTGAISYNSYQDYLLQWKWDFEGGSDELDTLIGSAAANSNIVLSLNVQTVAEQITDEAIKGEGKPIPGIVMQEAGAPNIIALVILIVLTISSLIVLGLALASTSKAGGGGGSRGGSSRGSSVRSHPFNRR